MGQTSSTVRLHEKRQEFCTKPQVLDLFQRSVLDTFKPSQLSVLASKLNVTSLRDNNVVTPSDLALLLQLTDKEEIDVQSSHSEFAETLQILCNSCVILGRMPFFNDSLVSPAEGQLTIDRLIVASAVHTGRIKSLWSDVDYMRLIFMSFAAVGKTKSLPPLTEKSSVQSEKTEESTYIVTSVGEGSATPLDMSQSILWSEFDNLITYDGVDIEKWKIPADVMIKVITLLLIVNSTPLQSHTEMRAILQGQISQSWIKFKAMATSLVRYMNIEVTTLCPQNYGISYDQFRLSSEFFLKFFSLAFERLFRYGFLGSIAGDPQNEISHLLGLKPGNLILKQPELEKNRLMNDSTLAVISFALQNAGVSTEISSSSVVKLFDGSHSGFSIRSLELKIFKWQAPTIFLISGKRLRAKTTTTNKRYQQLDVEYPRFFRSTESHTKEWQKEGEKITYAVYIKQPWRNSNKSNFGDESSVILNLFPRFDIFTSKHDPQLEGRLLYFNNLGMGLGFGNDQPVNKNKVRKFIPGKVSLTVEANLEFAVFRHIINSSAHTLAYFNFSLQVEAKNQDFEDRFMVTDLEVWGVGSSKELEEQKKQWEWEEKQAQARQSVNLNTLNEDRAFLEMVGLVGNHNGGGSM